MIIKNKKQLIDNGISRSQKKVRGDICKVLSKVVDNIDPYEMVLKNVKLKNNMLSVGKHNFNLKKYNNIYIAGAGKAVYKMACAIETILKNKITSGCINAPEMPEKCKLNTIEMCVASHPTPNIQGVRGTMKIKSMLEKAGKGDLVIGLISGGGSSLMPLPVKGVKLSDKIKMTSLLLKSSATITEINAVRKHLSQIKGGQFACLAYPATLVTLCISDVVNDSLDVIASGPSVPDTSTYEDAINVLKKYKIWARTAKSIRGHLLSGKKIKIKETPKKEEDAFCKGKIYNVMIANHNSVLQATTQEFKKLNYNTLELSSSIQGNARQVAKEFIEIGSQIKWHDSPAKKPAVIIGTGETTIQVHGKGKGGRNQELVLAGIRYLKEGMTLVSFATDGIDGRSPSAGAIADVGTVRMAIRKDLKISKYLANSDTFGFFEKVGDYIDTGVTGTNIGDLMMLVVV